MRFSIEALVGMIFFSFIVDYLLHKHYKELKEETPATFSFPFGAFWHYSVPAIFVLSFIIFGLLINFAASPGVYVYFQWFITVYLFIYLPKFIYIFTYKMTHNAIKVKNKFEPNGKIKKMNDGRYPKISRKKFLSQIGIFMASLPFVSLLFGVMKGRFNFSVKYNKLAFPNLPKAFEGLKIVQISDLHLGSLNSNYYEMEEAIRIINAEHPDLICFTGDLVNNFAEETIGWESVFGKLQAKHGKYSILGNHDYGDYSKWATPQEKDANLQGVKDAHQRLGFQLLNNESLTLTKGNDTIAIAGVENWGHPPFPQYGDLAKATKGIENIPFKLLLSHDPDHWDSEVTIDYDYDLTLAGHTHGMQFGFDYKGFQWSPAQYKFKRWSGLYREGHQFLYVNRGLGFLGMPARVGMPPEITVIELTQGAISNEPM